MTIYIKLVFHFIRLCRMTWYVVRYSIHPWKQLHSIYLPVNIGLGYSVLRFMDSGEYEQGEINIVSKTLEEKDIVLELGTGLGLLSAYCSKKIGSDRVQTYEANSSLKPLILKMYERNNVAPALHFAAMGIKEGETDFYVSTKGFFSSSTVHQRNAKKVRVPVLAVNEVIKKVKPTYLLMDIEGSEHDVFTSVAFQSIKKVQFELHPNILTEVQVKEIFDVLAQNNFVEDQMLSRGNNFYFYKSYTRD